VNASVSSQQDKANQIAIIEARADAQKQVLERKQRQADEQKARFDKAAAIANIILNTAEAVAKALPNIAKAILVGALGAAELSIAIATPIPHYKHGTKNHKGGLAVVGDAGKSEGIELPDGRILKTPSTDTLIDLPKGSKVYPDYEKMMIKATVTNVPSYREKTVVDNATPKIIAELKDVTKAIKKIPQPSITVDNVISRKIRGAGSTVNFVNRSV
jgi:hypothetical protein